MLSYRAVEAFAAKMAAMAAAPPSAKVLEPLAREAAAKGVQVALARRERVSSAVTSTGNTVRLSFRGPGGLAAQRRAMSHLDGRLWEAMQKVHEETVRSVGGRYT